MPRESVYNNPRDNIYQQLFDDPYGPYLENEVLTDKCKDVGSTLLPLTNFMMECGGKCIGLTQSETNQPEYKEFEDRINRYGVRFRGVLAIEKLEWVHSAARKRINRDIRLRHVALHLEKRGDTGTRNLNTPTLEKIYQVSSPTRMIKIIIQCNKRLPALYLKYDRLPNGLAVASENRKRWYEVVSMDVQTYAESRRYLGRYRALSILEQIIAIDKQQRFDRDEPERPREERTPHWFAQMYKKHLANTPEAQRRRIVWTSDDSDIAEGTEGQLKPGRAHVLRHVPTAEVLSLLATHAEWILDDQRVRISRTRLLDVDVWADWVRTAKRVRRDAHNAGVHWGALDRIGPDGLAQSSDEDVDREPVRARPRPKKKAKPKAPQRQARPTASSSSSRAGTSTAQPLFYPESDEDPAQGNVYDPDFSPPSSAPASDWDSDTSAGSVDPELIDSIPEPLFYPPALPDGSFVWECPVAGCDYDLRLLELTDAHYRCLLPEHVVAFRRGGWSLSERWVQASFMHLVSEHYQDHLDRLGILMWQEGKKTRAAWKNPKAHPPSRRRARRLPIVRPSSDDEIKAEEE